MGGGMTTHCRACWMIRSETACYPFRGVGCRYYHTNQHHLTQHPSCTHISINFTPFALIKTLSISVTHLYSSPISPSIEINRFSSKSHPL
jgi:hypothetical protein